MSELNKEPVPIFELDSKSQRLGHHCVDPSRHRVMRSQPVWM